MILKLVQRLFAVCHANELIILALQGCFQRNPHFGFVINNQYFFGNVIFHQNPHPNRES